MQSMLSPKEETMSLLDFCRRLSADETAVIEAARVSLVPPARAQRPRRDLVTDDVSNVDDYDDDNALPLDANGSQRNQIHNEMKTQEDTQSRPMRSRRVSSSELMPPDTKLPSGRRLPSAVTSVSNNSRRSAQLRCLGACPVGQAAAVPVCSAHWTALTMEYTPQRLSSSP